MSINNHKMKSKITITLLLVSFHFISQELELKPLPSQINSVFVDSILETVIDPNTRIIVLGEENHGGELTNQINAGIIYDLVTKYGFTNLVFESDFFGLLYSDSIRNNNTFRNNVYPAWSASVAFEKINKLFLDKELAFLGVDSRHHGEYSRLHLIDYLKKQEKNISDSSALFYKVTKSILENEFRDTLLVDNSQDFFFYIKSWQSKLDDTTVLLHHVLTNLNNYAQQLLYEREDGVEKYVAFRELSMIVNTEYILKKRTPDEKCIILGASLHVQPGITGLSKHASKNIGDYIFENYAEESLFLLPVVYSGKTQNHAASKPQKVSKRAKRKTIQPQLSKSNSFALVKYCYTSDYSLFPNAFSFGNKSFCGDFIFIKEEVPRRFHD
jgi:hypothetical protein